jgi:hypothetical protein
MAALTRLVGFEATSEDHVMTHRGTAGSTEAVMKVRLLQRELALVLFAAKLKEAWEINTILELDLAPSDDKNDMGVSVWS